MGGGEILQTPLRSDVDWEKNVISVSNFIMLEQRRRKQLQDQLRGPL